MKTTKFMKEASFAAVIILLMIFCSNNSVAAETTAPADTWQYEFTLYGWFASIDGTLKYNIPGSGSSITVDTSDLLDSLNFMFMGVFEARKNKLSFAADLIYMSVSNSKSTDIRIGPGPGPGIPLSVSAGLSLKAWVLSGIVGYDVVQTNKNRMAVIGGFRYLDISADASIAVNGPLPPTPPPAYISGSNEFWDGIIGIRGAFMLNENWYIPYYADIGAGQSDLTWQLFAGIGYMFNWGDIKLGYRYLEYDMDDDKLVQDLKLYGPVLGIGFRF